VSEDHAAEARRAERLGDRGRALALWQAHVRTHPQDGEARLATGRLFLEAGEPATARRILLALDDPAWGPAAPEANRLLARLDQQEGMIASAVFRWERLLADDIDDPEALRNLRMLRGNDEPMVGSAPPTWLASTLLTPEGVDLQRYRLIRELGRGTNGVVYLARDARVGRDVALKLLHPGPSTPERRDREARFFAGQKALARLRHPALVAILALDPATRSLALEPMAGGSLRTWLRESAAALPLEARLAEAETVLSWLASALVYVHGRGLLHGDVKPANILRREDGAPALSDFGGAGMGETAGADQVTGTPLYFAPELFRGAAASPATDAFALGAVAWEVLTGEPWRAHADLLAGRYDLRPALPAAWAEEKRAALARLLEDVHALTAAEPTPRLDVLAARAADATATFTRAPART
jgi:hypothetical protein